MPDFMILSCNREVGAHGEFDHAGITFRKRTYDISQIIAVVLNDPGKSRSSVMRALKAAGGAAIGSLLGRAIRAPGAGVVGAAMGAGAGVLAAGEARRTQAAIVLADGLVAVVEVDDVAAGALLLVSRAVADHHKIWGAPSPKALPAKADDDGLIVDTAQALIAALPSRADIAATTRKAIVVMKRVDWPELPNPFRKRM